MGWTFVSLQKVAILCQALLADSAAGEALEAQLGVAVGSWRRKGWDSSVLELAHTDLQEPIAKFPGILQTGC